MLSVCSATHCCSSHSQISLLGTPLSICPYQKDAYFRSFHEDRILPLPSWNVKHHQRLSSFRTQAAKSVYSIIESNLPASSVDTKCSFYSGWSSSCQARSGRVILEQYNLSAVDGEMDLPGLSSEKMDSLIRSIEPETVTSGNIGGQDTILESTSSLVSDSSSFSATASFDDVFTRIQDSVGASVNTGEKFVTSSLNSINSSLTSITKSASQAVDDIRSRVFSNIDQTGELAGNRLSGLLNDSKDATTRLTGVSADILRRTIIVVEDSIVKGTYFVVYSYGSAKELLPPEIRDAVNVTEDRVTQILRPVGTTLQEVSTAIGGLERRFGLDPEDPVITFILCFGSLGALWAFYWIWTYAGYAGELSPEATLDFLKSEKKAMLIDVRPEASDTIFFLRVLRERDGVPDLRRATRSRYASVTLPEVDSSVRKLLRGGKEIEDSLIAAVIRNLKAVQDRSNVIIMDADGTASKGVARSLSKLGVKKAYLVKGGFNSWVKHDLRIKELKPETTLTVLNEEAEAILEGVSPLQVIGYGVYASSCTEFNTVRFCCNIPIY
ncbi:Calcium sensing receptor, chloroplastic [Linum grandiflorum]